MKDVANRRGLLARAEDCVVLCLFRCSRVVAVPWRWGGVFRRTNAGATCSAWTCRLAAVRIPVIAFLHLLVVGPTSSAAQDVPPCYPGSPVEGFQVEH